jgi:uncharacterized ParB-like nuclease family protein
MHATSFVAQQLRLGIIEARAGRRPVNQDAVDRLAESMAEIGLQQLITVKRREIGEGGGYWLVTGAHRLAAAHKLGWETIPTYIVQMSDRDARLWEISENLHRAELTVGERADQIAEWVRLTAPSEEVGQVDPVSGGRGNTGGVRAAAHHQCPETKCCILRIKHLSRYFAYERGIAMPKWVLQEFRGTAPTGFEFRTTGSEEFIRKMLELLAARHLTNDEILDALFGASNDLNLSPTRRGGREGLMTSGANYFYVVTKEHDD